MEIKGITDAVNECGCCGKKNLKKTVVLMDGAGEIVYFGSDCAAAALTGRTKNRKDGEVIKGRAIAINAFYSLTAAGQTLEQAADYVTKKGWGNIHFNRRTGLAQIMLASKGTSATYQTL